MILLFLQVFFVSLSRSYVQRLFDAEHFDDIRRDTPVEKRPPNVVAFYRPGACEQRLAKLDLPGMRRSKDFPSRSQLQLGHYNIAEQDSKWYNFYPDVMDLPARFNVTRRCPAIVYIGRHCPFWQPCEDFEVYKRKKHGRLKGWIKSKLEQSHHFQNPFADTVYLHVDEFHRTKDEGICHTYEIPGKSDLRFSARIMDKFQITKTTEVDPEGDFEIISPEHAYGTMDISALPKYDEAEVLKTDNWIRSRDRTTCTTHVRNNFVPAVIPLFATGLKKMKMHPELISGLMGFMEKNFDRTHMENWGASQTQMNYFEKPTRLIYLDWDWRLRDRLANTYIKPMLQEWSGIEDLELTAFYGIREYVQGSWLRWHVDRIDTHVLSATMTLKVEGQPEGEDWPLEVIHQDGTRSAVTTEPGSIVLYESAKIVHGRPKVFNGTYYYACFAHYRPRNVDGGKWTDYANKANADIQKNMALCRESSLNVGSKQGGTSRGPRS